MKKHEIGSFINNGMTSQEIQERIKDFPYEPSIQYFVDIGYSLNTAKQYRSRLKKNNRILSKQDNKNGSFVISPKADKANIILDTSALKSEETVDILENANSIIVLYPTIKEFDTLNKSENGSAYFKFMIREQTRKILFSEDSKYRLVPFGYKVNCYTDELILDYLFNLPIAERPTLLTCDHNLALRAKCLGFEYIDFIMNNNHKANNASTSTRTPIKDHFMDSNQKPKIQSPKNSMTDLGVRIVYDEIINIHKYNRKARIFLVKNGICQNLYNTSQVEPEQVEYFAVIAESKKNSVIKIQKIWLENNQKEKKEFQCYCEDDFKPLEGILHPTILNSAKELL